LHKNRNKDFFFSKQNLKVKRPENSFCLVNINDKKMFPFVKIASKIFVYARPYIDGVPAHGKQQVAVEGHNGQSTKCYLKRKKIIKVKI
jgi:hypothetical protein